MKGVRAQFAPPRRPGRRTWIAIAVLAAGVVALAGAVAWQARRVHDLKEQVAALADQRKAAAETAPLRPEPPYGDSARLFLRAREAAWAPALRSLESAAMIGVTPVRIEFDGADDTVRAELEYRDADALHDYLSRLNEGSESSTSVGRWRLLETHAQASADRSPSGAGSGVMTSNVPGVAVIRSTWR